MKDKIISKRYAISFLETSAGSDVDSIYSDFMAFVKVFAGDEKLRYVLAHPEIDLGRKITLTANILGENGQKIACNFICLLVKRQRINLLKKIEREVTALYKKQKGIRDIIVKSAVPLNEEERSKLNTILKRKFGHLDITEEVDPSVVGGLIICFEDRLLDESIRFRLKKLKELMVRIDNEWLASLIDQPGLAI